MRLDCSLFVGMRNLTRRVGPSGANNLVCLRNLLRFLMLPAFFEYAGGNARSEASYRVQRQGLRRRHPRPLRRRANKAWGAAARALNAKMPSWPQCMLLWTFECFWLYDNICSNAIDGRVTGTILTVASQRKSAGAMRHAICSVYCRSAGLTRSPMCYVWDEGRQV